MVNDVDKADSSSGDTECTNSIPSIVSNENHLRTNAESAAVTTLLCDNNCNALHPSESFKTSSSANAQGDTIVPSAVCTRENDSSELDYNEYSDLQNSTTSSTGIPNGPYGDTCINTKEHLQSDKFALEQKCDESKSGASSDDQCCILNTDNVVRAKNESDVQQGDSADESPEHRCTSDNAVSDNHMGGDDEPAISGEEENACMLNSNALESDNSLEKSVSSSDATLSEEDLQLGGDENSGSEMSDSTNRQGDCDSAHGSVLCGSQRLHIKNNLKAVDKDISPKHFLVNNDETDILLEKLETELGNNKHGSQSKAYLSLQDGTPSNLSASTSRSSLTEGGGGGSGDEDKYKVLFDHYELQIEFLENKNRELQHELAQTKEKVAQQELELQTRTAQARSEMAVHIEKLTKQLEAKKKDLESMVVRYAQSEREAILHKKAREEFDKKLKDSAKERDNLINKIKVLNVERARLCSSLDNKLAEIASVQKDNEWFKEEVNSRDIKIKWLQNKLKTEVDAHKETQLKLDQTLKRLNETKEEAEQIRKECQSMIHHYQQAEERKAENSAKESSVSEHQKQEQDDLNELHQVKQELEGLKRKHKLSIDENNALTVKIQSLERDRLDYEQTVSKLKEFQISLQQEIADLNNKLVETESIKMQLEREKEKVAASQKEVARLKMTNAELQADVEACHSKEGELLEFTEKLTAKTVSLQSEHSLLEAKAQNLEQQLSKATKKCTELEAQVNSLKAKIDEQDQQYQQETQLLARKLAEKTKAVENLNVKLADAKSENSVIMKRHVASIRELTRELQLVKKKLNSYEAKRPGTGAGDSSASLGSRTSSSNSLDLTAPHHSGCSHQATPVNSPISSGAATRRDSSRESQSASNQGPPEISKQMLIERIVLLQKSLARKNEKIEFLKELVNQLQMEIKKKSRIVQNYILREESGTLAACSGKEGELPRRTGMVNSSYSLQPDSTMTLELSLEINSKLQAVLEDMILKNITLKENINTLGEEIARMTKEQSQ